MKRAALTFVLLALGLVLAAAPAIGAPKRVGVDKRFGSGGWANVPRAPGKATTEPSLLCAAGKGGSSLVAARFFWSKPQVSALVNLNSRGRRNKRFGNNGTLRFGPNEVPAEISRAPGAKWLVTFQDSTGKHRKVVRLNSNGRRDPAFGVGGVLQFPGGDNVATFETLTGGGLVAYPSSGPQVFDADGHPQTRINGDGRISVPFSVTSVFEMRSGKLLVVGRLGDQLVATMLEPDGTQSSTWNGGAPLAIGPAPDSSWKPFLEPRYNPPRTYTARPPSFVRPVREVSGAVELHFGFEVSSEPTGSDDQKVTVRLRILPSGELDSRLSGNGWAYWNAEYVTVEPEAGDDTIEHESFFLPDGRQVSAHFIYGSEQDPGSWASFRISDRDGRWSTRGARRLTINRLRFGDYDFDAAGKNLIVCGIRDFYRPVVGRVRL